MRPREPYPFLDWMKAIGIAAIVYGHVAHVTTVTLTPPVYLKQFGVALFVFATGFTLAAGNKPPRVVILSRLFPVYLYGCLLAALLTIVGASTGSGAALSNALPFLGGMNVVLDHFPANPSTWYVGTYLHLLLLWAWFLRPMQIGWPAIAVALCVEVVVRAMLLAYVGPYVAYMAFTSWIGVFLLGMLHGGRRQAAPASSPLPFVVLLVLGIAGWMNLAWVLGPIPTFPFMTLAGSGVVTGSLVVSLAASTLYLLVTMAVFEATRRAAAPAIVRFAARNSLIVFLAHMPSYFALQPLLARSGLSYWSRVTVLLVICGPVLACVSEAIQKMAPPDRLRAALLSFGSGPIDIEGLRLLRRRLTP
jgi:fucose 4-O-acetylase-like acetyltransferase